MPRRGGAGPRTGRRLLPLMCRVPHMGLRKAGHTEDVVVALSLRPAPDGHTPWAPASWVCHFILTLLLLEDAPEARLRCGGRAEVQPRATVLPSIFSTVTSPARLEGQPQVHGSAWETCSVLHSWFLAGPGDGQHLRVGLGLRALPLRPVPFTAAEAAQGRCSQLIQLGCGFAKPSR